MKFTGTSHTFVEPSDAITGEITVPGDKSISHRAIILGSIAEGTTRITGLLEGEDNVRTIDAFRAMGVNIERVSSGEFTVEGVGLHGLKEPDDVIYAGNSGTTARLLTGLLSAQSFFTVLTGDASLRGRPMSRVLTPLSKMGALISGRDDGRYLPLAIKGGALKGTQYDSPVSSAQVKSAILLAGLYAQGDTTVNEPRISRDHTERIFAAFGAEVSREGTSVTVSPVKKRLKGTKVAVPGDLSSAAFFMVAAAITGASHLVIKDVGVNPTRCGIIDILKRMGCDITLENLREGTEPVADIVVKSSTLNGIDISGEELLPAIDEFPIICVAAALAQGKTTISGASELRVKESDRISAMATVLGKLGAVVEERDDGIVIDGVEELKSAMVDCFDDHRIAMSVAIASLRTNGGVQIDGAEAVEISFPDFFVLLSKLAM